VIAELKAYRMMLSKEQRVASDCLGFWRASQERFPKLAICARILLSIPATSASVERMFSCAGLVKDERPTQLPETTESLVILHENCNGNGLFSSSRGSSKQ